MAGFKKRMSASPAFQTTQSWFHKKNCAAPRFCKTLLGVRKTDEAVFLVFDILRKVLVHTAA